MKEDFNKASLYVISAALGTFFLMAILIGGRHNDKIVGKFTPQLDVVPMPIVEDSNPITASIKTLDPIEQRGPEVRQWLAPGLQIRVSNASGSGTIVYYDSQTGWAYVASCGHLWNGTRSADELKRNPVKAKVITWYHNDQKLSEPKEYPAEVLFWSNKRGYDSSCLRFKPDWIPNYFPIAPKDHPIAQGSKLHSVGCDGGREIAHYDVEVIEPRGDDLVTRYNSPRPGRSGGGLMDDDGWYVGTCWGTSDIRGNGIGYFTPLSSIHEVFSSNGYDWLLKMGMNNLARQIPIKDWQNPQREYPGNYIPIPGINKMPLPR